jgi:hypothetical protein
LAEGAVWAEAVRPEGSVAAAPSPLPFERTTAAVMPPARTNPPAIAAMMMALRCGTAPD